MQITTPLGRTVIPLKSSRNFVERQKTTPRQVFIYSFQVLSAMKTLDRFHVLQSREYNPLTLTTLRLGKSTTVYESFKTLSVITTKYEADNEVGSTVGSIYIKGDMRVFGKTTRYIPGTGPVILSN